MPARVAPEAADLASVVQTVVATSRWRRAVRGCTELDTEGLGGEVGLRRRLVGLAAAVTLAIFVGEQFVWVTPSGKPIGLKWLIYLGTDDSKDLARCAVLMRALINPLGLVGCASWLVFVKDSDEGEMRRAWLWEIISFVKHVGPEAAFLLDVHVRPRPMLHVADAALGLVVPATYATFLVAYYYAGGTNYENERVLYASLDDPPTILAAGALWVLSVPFCVAIHRGYMELVVKGKQRSVFALSRAQIEDIEGDILDGFRSTPKDDILNGWDATTNNYYDGTRAEGCGDAAHADLWDGDGPSHLNGTAYEELVFRDRVVDVVEAHGAARPLFIYYALHTSCVGYDPDGTAGGERDSLQPDRAYYDKFSFIDDDDRRANVAMVALMDDVAGDVTPLGENATRATHGGDACYFSKPYKLLVGSVRQNGWPGQIHPNTSVAWDSFADVLDCAAGCLFDVVADPEERRDLAAAMPDTVAELRARLERAAFYDPDRGDPDPRACAVAAATGCWGPFLP
ncbi:sulfuric ester hydrolase [Aureococcus anophagefferens]|nr:sulfuric ester hydrolase [Aureococcus anophagefferens]